MAMAWQKPDRHATAAEASWPLRCGRVRTVWSADDHPACKSCALLASTKNLRQPLWRMMLTPWYAARGTLALTSSMNPNACGKQREGASGDGLCQRRQGRASVASRRMGEPTGRSLRVNTPRCGQNGNHISTWLDKCGSMGLTRATAV